MEEYMYSKDKKILLSIPNDFAHNLFDSYWNIERKRW